MSKISQLTTATDLASTDLLEIVDVSDTATMGVSTGTNKKITALTLANQLSTIGNYAQSSHTHSNASTTTAGFMSSTDKSKLDGLSNYTHPTGDGNLHVPATGTNNNGKVLTAGATAGSMSWATPTVSLDSPAFTGTPTAPTAQTGTNTTQIATTQFVQNAVAGITNTGSPTYLITSNVPIVAEGSAVTFTVTTTDPTVTQLYWTTTDSTDVTPVNGTINLNGNTGTFTTTAITDTVGEGLDTFTVYVRTGSITGTIVGSCSVNISDNPVVYSLIPNTTVVTEGGTVTFDVVATNTPGTTLYWTTTSTDVTVSSGAVGVINNTGSFSITVKTDDFFESGESFVVNLRVSSLTGTIVATSTINITEASGNATPVWTAMSQQNTIPGLRFPDAFDINANGDIFVFHSSTSTALGTWTARWTGTTWIRGEFIVDFGAGDPLNLRINDAGNIVIGAKSNIVYTFIYNGSQWSSLAPEVSNGAISLEINSAGNRFISGINTAGGRGGRVYAYNPSSGVWESLGQSIIQYKEQTSAGQGTSVSMNGIGDIVAISAPELTSLAGAVQVYKYNPSTNQWGTHGQELIGFSAAGDRFGSSVSLNGAGDRIAIGAPNSDSNGADAGKVRVYSYNSTSNTWTQLGQDINGEAAGDLSGTSVRINAAGDRVAIGAPGNDDAGSDKGHVRVYQWNSVTSLWEKIGLDISDSNRTFSGLVKMNSNGDIVFIGANNNQSLVYKLT